MRNSPLIFVFSVLTLVIGAALEEIFPKVADVGFPVLLVAVQFMAARRPAFAAAVFAVAAGAMEDAVSSLPVMTSVSYFLAVTALVKWSEFPRGAIVLTYPFYQVWLWLWVSFPGFNVFRRVLVSLPVGIFAAFVTGAVLVWAERRAALDEEG